MLLRGGLTRLNLTALSGVVSGQSASKVIGTCILISDTKCGIEGNDFLLASKPKFLAESIKDIRVKINEISLNFHTNQHDYFC